MAQWQPKWLCSQKTSVATCRLQPSSAQLGNATKQHTTGEGRRTIGQVRRGRKSVRRIMGIEITGVGRT
jgi:hypothetical protein